MSQAGARKPLVSPITPQNAAIHWTRQILIQLPVSMYHLMMQANPQTRPNFSPGQATQRGTYFTERFPPVLVEMNQSPEVL